MEFIVGIDFFGEKEYFLLRITIVFVFLNV